MVRLESAARAPNLRALARKSALAAGAKAAASQLRRQGASPPSARTPTAPKENTARQGTGPKDPPRKTRQEAAAAWRQPMLPTGQDPAKLNLARPRPTAAPLSQAHRAPSGNDDGCTERETRPPPQHCAALLSAPPSVATSGHGRCIQSAALFKAPGPQLSAFPSSNSTSFSTRGRSGAGSDRLQSEDN